MPENKPLLLQLAERGVLKSAIESDLEDDDEGGSGSGARTPEGLDIAGLPRKETRAMEIERREQEQAGHRRYAKVNAREKSPDEPEAGQALGNGLKSHPFLDNQRYDGIDQNLNPAPPNNPDALAEFEDNRKEQELQKQHRLGLANDKKYDPSMTPRPGG